MFMEYFYLFILFQAVKLHFCCDICCCLFLFVYFLKDFFIFVLVALFWFLFAFVWFFGMCLGRLFLGRVFEIRFRSCCLCLLLYFALCLDILCLFVLLVRSYFGLFDDSLLIVVFVRLLIDGKRYFRRIMELSYWL